jgi:hypothetical protein
MDSTIYTEIIESILIPFGEEVYGGRYYLHQDNSSIHCSAECEEQIENEQIKWVGAFGGFYIVKTCLMN